MVSYYSHYDTVCLSHIDSHNQSMRPNVKLEGNYQYIRLDLSLSQICIVDSFLLFKVHQDAMAVASEETKLTEKEYYLKIVNLIITKNICNYLQSSSFQEKVGVASGMEELFTINSLYKSIFYLSKALLCQIQPLTSFDFPQLPLTWLALVVFSLDRRSRATNGTWGQLPITKYFAVTKNMAKYKV